MKRFLTLLLLCVCFINFIIADASGIFEKKGKIVILMYHKLSENESEWSDYCISPQMFERDIAYLKNNGYIFLKASELVAADLDDKKIAVITFDDGYFSDYRYAADILEKYNASATFFVYGGAVDTKDYMTSENIKALSKKNFIEIGNHSHMLHSKNLYELQKMYSNQSYHKTIAEDFFENARLLEQITGNKITALSYPNGIYSQPVDDLLRKQGNVITFSTKSYSYRGINPMAVIGRKTRSVTSKLEELLK